MKRLLIVIKCDIKSDALRLAIMDQERIMPTVMNS